jgi:hypothetical protein
MLIRVFFYLLLIFLIGSSSPAFAGKLVREFSGSRSIYTTDFKANDPWLIDWRVESPNPRSMSVSVTLIDARTDSHAGRVVQTMREGDGLRLMNQSGAFRFRVDAKESDWNIRVIQLNREEAKLYRPKN